MDFHPLLYELNDYIESKWILEDNPHIIGEVVIIDTLLYSSKDLYYEDTEDRMELDETPVITQFPGIDYQIDRVPLIYSFCRGPPITNYIILTT